MNSSGIPGGLLSDVGREVGGRVAANRSRWRRREMWTVPWARAIAVPLKIGRWAVCRQFSWSDNFALFFFFYGCKCLREGIWWLGLAGYLLAHSREASLLFRRRLHFIRVAVDTIGGWNFNTVVKQNCGIGCKWEMQRMVEGPKGLFSWLLALLVLMLSWGQWILGKFSKNCLLEAIPTLLFKWVAVPTPPKRYIPFSISENFELILMIAFCCSATD